MNTNEKNDGLSTYKSYDLSGGRTYINFELGVNTRLDTIVAKLITLRRYNKVVFNMVNACGGCTSFLQAEARNLGNSELLKN